MHVSTYEFRKKFQPAARCNYYFFLLPTPTPRRENNSMAPCINSNVIKHCQRWSFLPRLRSVFCNVLRVKKIFTSILAFFFPASKKRKELQTKLTQSTGTMEEEEELEITALDVVSYLIEVLDDKITTIRKESITSIMHRDYVGLFRIPGKGGVYLRVK